MKKRLNIHIGPPKTGTSVIQFWLNQHISWLKNQGIYYPGHNVDSNSVSSGHRALFLEKRTDTTRTQFNHDKFETLLTEFEATECRSLLLSSEFFFYQVPEFLKYQDKYSIRFIAYIRADVELVESLYNQSVKRNRQILPLAARSQLPKSYLDDLADFITAYSSGLFLLRAYGNSDVFEHNITTDLLSAIGLTVRPKEQKQPDKINSSYSFECLEVKRWLNRFALTDIDARIDLCLQGYKGNNQSYTLLPAPIYSGYQTQSLDKINRLQALAPIYHYDRLINYVSVKQRGEYIHQELYLSHLEKVAQYMVSRDRNLVEILVSRIAETAAEARDLERLQVLKSVLSKAAPDSKKINWFNRVSSWLRK